MTSSLVPGSGRSGESTQAPSNRPLVAETTFHVRYAETDQMGIVHHSAYLVWFEEGRSAWTRQAGRPYADFERTGYVLAVSEVGARYLTPARYDQKVTVRTRLSRLRSRLSRFDYEVIDTETGNLLVTGFTSHVCLDNQGKPARIPAEWRQFWLGLVAEA
ncbi:MAG: acyl-CoA thioesterase [Anaerolineales bacterium]|nr:MAG: acyl-CoA thioesterase [Anaerolineales bacterium]